MDPNPDVESTTTDMADAAQSSADPAHHTVMTPPNSDEGCKHETDLSSLDLNEEDEDEDEEVVPDHYWEGGKIPVFKPTMDQFRSFKNYIAKIDKYGMKSGIVKVIPPKEWRDSLPALDEAIKSIKVKNPITQEISGKSGTYTQANIEKQRSYNLPQWKSLTEESQHQPPAKRGERRRAIDKPTKARPEPPVNPSDGTVRRRGRPAKGSKPTPRQEPTPSVEGENSSDRELDLKSPPTPTSPEKLEDLPTKKKKVKVRSGAPKPRGNQAKSVSERRKYNQQEIAEDVDEEAFEGFDYRFYGNDEFTPERCQELEALYWKTLTYAAPMYGADMPGSLFDDNTTSWNVAKLENLLDVLGTKVPGVNTAYLYLGMWKATFAWHLEDVDLYSINYIHFGAPKQWYSVSQEDARRFESAMKSLWPNDSKNCNQFLRHKTYLVSPTLLQEQFNLKVNRLVHYEGEFVITYPYGYHSGYNLGYNCAESVNFATEDWLEFGKIAKKCDCEADSVWVDAHYIERKLKGEPTPEYFEETDEDDDLDHGEFGHVPTPPSSTAGKAKAGRKRKREAQQPPTKVRKKVKLRVKQHGFEPCVLCPNNMPFEKLMPTDNGRHAHAVCALYTPETYIWPETKSENGEPQIVYGVDSIAKERLGLRCYFCNSKKGACFQCSAKKCTRAYHATCAAAAGVRVDSGRTPFFVDGGDEYWIEDNDFRCRFHRTKRPKHAGSDSLERDHFIKTYLPRTKLRTIVQAQYFQGEIFAGVVVENRPDEQTVVLDVLPEGGNRIEVEYKWILVQDPNDSQLPRPSANCLGPLPEQFSKTTTQNRNDEYRLPLPDDPFHGDGSMKWAEFSALDPQDISKLRHHRKVAVQLENPNTLWHYVGEISTEARSYFTEDVAKRRNNPASNFLDTVKPAPSSAIHNHKSSLSLAPNAASHVSNVPLQRQRSQSNLISQTYSSAARYQYKPASFARPSSARDTSSQQNAPMTNTPRTYDHNAFQMSRVPEWIQQTQQSCASLPVYKHTFQPYSNQREESPDVSTPHNNSSAEAASSWPQREAGTASGVADLNPVTGSGTALSGQTLVNRPPSGQGATTAEYLERVRKYPYLRNSFLRRPQKYVSPYTKDEVVGAVARPSSSPTATIGI